jgi:hypothetical protein
MADYGHVGETAFGSEAHEVVVEDDVHDPMQPVLDAPVEGENAAKSELVQFGTRRDTGRNRCLPQLSRQGNLSRDFKGLKAGCAGSLERTGLRAGFPCLQGIWREFRENSPGMVDFR